MAAPIKLDDPKVQQLLPLVEALMKACKSSGVSAIVQMQVDESNTVQTVSIHDISSLSPDMAITLAVVRSNYTQASAMCAEAAEDPGTITERRHNTVQ